MPETFYYIYGAIGHLREWHWISESFFRIGSEERHIRLSINDRCCSVTQSFASEYNWQEE